MGSGCEASERAKPRRGRQRWDVRTEDTRSRGDQDGAVNHQVSPRCSNMESEVFSTQEQRTRRSQDAENVVSMSG